MVNHIMNSFLCKIVFNYLEVLGPFHVKDFNTLIILKIEFHFELEILEDILQFR